MALNDLYNVIKADRYTADGCEKINEALAKETEDRVYQNGEISQKTGLMKTPKGWVEPPKGKAAKAESKPASTEWETKGKYQIKNFENENELDNFLKEKGYQFKESSGTSFSDKGEIHETVYTKGNETLVKLVGPGIKKPTIRRKGESSAESKPTDAAPRVLTGDTKIRVRK